MNILLGAEGVGESEDVGSSVGARTQHDRYVALQRLGCVTNCVSSAFDDHKNHVLAPSCREIIIFDTSLINK